MGDELGDYLNKVFSPDGGRKKKNKKGLLRRGSVQVGMVFVAGIGVLALSTGVIIYNNPDMMSAQNNDASDPAQKNNDGGNNNSSPGQYGDSEKGSDLPYITTCGDQKEIRLPINWRVPSVDGPREDILDDVINGLREGHATRPEAIAITAKAFAASDMQNPVNSNFEKSLEAENTLGERNSDDNRGGTFVEPMTADNWTDVMDPEISAKTQLKELRDIGIQKYSEHLTPMSGSNEQFIALSNAALASLQRDQGVEIRCSPVKEEKPTDDIYSVAEGWIGTPSSPSSGDIMLGPTLSDDNKSGVPSFGAMELVGYSLYQSGKQNVAESIQDIRLREEKEDERGAVVIGTKNGSPFLVGISDGEGEVIIADEREGVIKKVPLSEFGEGPEFR